METIVRYSTRALPVRRYVLGVGARPQGDSSDTPRTIEPSAYEGEWRYGVDLFNYAYYWEAHEAWEAVWTSTRAEPERTIVQGFIQIAAALLQLERAQRERLRLDAVHGLALRGVAKVRLGAAQSALYRGLALRKLVPEFEKFLTQLETAGPRDLAGLEPPRLELAAQETPVSPSGRISLKDMAARASGAPAPAAPPVVKPLAKPAPPVVATGDQGEALEGVTLESLGADPSEEDRRALSLLLRDVVDGGAAVGFLQPPSVELAAEFWNDVLRGVADGSRLLVVARLERIIVGAVQLELCPLPNGRHRAGVQKLMVLRTRWRSGIGRALMLEVEETARRLGRMLLVLDARVGDPAEQVYERAGYLRVGTIPAYLTNEAGGYDSVVFLYKHLSRR